jgi:hypothetical protein
MNEDPSNEAFVLPLLKGYNADDQGHGNRAPPLRRISRPSTSPGSTEGNSPRIRPRLGASPEKPSHSP